MSAVRDMLDKARRAIARKGAASQDVDDVVHEAYLRVLEYEQRAEVKSTEALLVSAAVNLFYDKVRRRKYSPLVEVKTELTGVDDAPGADDILRSQARLRRTIEGLDQLPEKTRRILISRRLDGKSYKDIAEAEGMTLSAVPGPGLTVQRRQLPSGHLLQVLTVEKRSAPVSLTGAPDFVCVFSPAADRPRSRQFRTQLPVCLTFIVKLSWKLGRGACPDVRFAHFLSAWLRMCQNPASLSLPLSLSICPT